MVAILATSDNDNNKIMVNIRTFGPHCVILGLRPSSFPLPLAKYRHIITAMIILLGVQDYMQSPCAHVVCSKVPDKVPDGLARGISVLADYGVKSWRLLNFKFLVIK